MIIIFIGFNLLINYVEKTEHLLYLKTFMLGVLKGWHWLRRRAAVTWLVWFTRGPRPRRDVRCFILKMKISQIALLSFAVGNASHDQDPIHSLPIL
jgi:hypothetical protein